MNFVISTNLAEVLITKKIIMKDLFFMGGPAFMAILTLLLIITTAWIIYHFMISYKSKQTNKENMLRKIGYGKSMGLFTMIVGITGQMNGLYAMFSVIEEVTTKGTDVNIALVFEGIKVTMICTIYGIIIYLISLVLWFAASTVIEKKCK